MSAGTCRQEDGWMRGRHDELRYVSDLIALRMSSQTLGLKRSAGCGRAEHFQLAADRL